MRSETNTSALFPCFSIERCARQFANLAPLFAALALGVGGTAGAASSEESRPPVMQAENSENSDFEHIGDHLKQALSPELLGNFALFIYVDKAVAGPYAQRMFVFQKTEQGDLDPLFDWRVSTGLETIETDLHGRLQSSRTPKGFYELDPKRFYTEHRSYEWNEPMPYAMFFDWHAQGHDTGLSIHGVEGATAYLLGRRASEGCIHLSLDHAQSLHDLIQLKYAEQVPVLVYLNEVSDISSDGQLQHDSRGNLQFKKGYSVLVLVDDFGEELPVGPTAGHRPLA
jgi:hypothetical protein